MWMVVQMVMWMVMSKLQNDILLELHLVLGKKSYTCLKNTSKTPKIAGFPYF